MRKNRFYRVELLGRDMNGKLVYHDCSISCGEDDCYEVFKEAGSMDDPGDILSEFCDVPDEAVSFSYCMREYVGDLEGNEDDMSLLPSATLFAKHFTIPV